MKLKVGLRLRSGGRDRYPHATSTTRMDALAGMARSTDAYRVPYGVPPLLCMIPYGPSAWSLDLNRVYGQAPVQPLGFAQLESRPSTNIYHPPPVLCSVSGHRGWRSRLAAERCASVRLEQCRRQLHSSLGVGKCGARHRRRRCGRIAWRGLELLELGLGLGLWLRLGLGLAVHASPGATIAPLGLRRQGPEAAPRMSTGSVWSPTARRRALHGRFPFL